jgi:hypothetical protein
MFSVVDMIVPNYGRLFLWEWLLCSFCRWGKMVYNIGEIVNPNNSRSVAVEDLNKAVLPGGSDIGMGSVRVRRLTADGVIGYSAGPLCLCRLFFWGNNVFMKDHSA